MKKLFSKILAGALCLCLIFLLGACNKTEMETSSTESKPETSIVGVWQGEIDLSKLLGEGKDASMAILIGDEPIYIGAEVSFKEDGSYTATIDLNTAAVKMQEVVGKAEKFNINLAKLMLLKVKDKLQDSSVTEEELELAITSLLETIKELDTETMTPYTTEGRYRYENGRLFCIQKEGVLSETDALSCTLTDTTLTITGIETDEPLMEELSQKEFEIIFTKVK